MEGATSSLDGVPAPRQTLEVCSEVVTFGLEGALLIFALRCIRLQRPGFPLLNVCPVHGFITEPRASVPVGACAPGVQESLLIVASAETVSGAVGHPI